MFKPVFVPGFEHKICSMYIANTVLNAGALVDIDTSDTAAITGSYGYGLLRAGAVKLATINSSSAVPKELGIPIVDVTVEGPSVIERMLRLATAYLTVPVGLNVPIMLPVPGDIFATTEYVGNLPGDSSLTGYINTASTGNFGAACEVYSGRIRLVQSGNPVRYEYLGNTTASGLAVAMFRCV